MAKERVLEIRYQIDASQYIMKIDKIFNYECETNIK